ncbi:MAG TPA: hypothetical protein VM186_07415 [Planctomycetota bacterium]|nr:hypothetical protein [Planctomycetota bacterium]
MNGVLPIVEKALRELQAQCSDGKTLSNYAASLKAFCAWCIERGYLAEHPLAGLAEFDTTPQTMRRALTPQEFHRILDAAPEHRRILYETAACSGLRRNELRSL